MKCCLPEGNLKTTSSFWRNRSVLQLADERDPVEAIKQKARECVFSAIDKGWTGPPFSPFDLAQILGIQLIAREDIREARTQFTKDGKFLIAYNPSRPASRLRYS